MSNILLQGGAPVPVARIVQKLDWCAMYGTAPGRGSSTCGENCAEVGLVCYVLLQGGAPVPVARIVQKLDWCAMYCSRAGLLLHRDTHNSRDSRAC